MSDSRRPNAYEELKKTHSEIDAKAAQEQAAALEELAKTERAERFGERFTAMLREDVEAGKLRQHEIGYQLQRAENDPEFRKAAEAKLEKWEASRAEETAAQEAPAREAEESDKPGVEMTDARSIRMQRIKEITDQLAEQRSENEGQQHGTERDSGDRSR